MYVRHAQQWVDLEVLERCRKVAKVCKERVGEVAGVSLGATPGDPVLEEVGVVAQLLARQLQVPQSLAGKSVFFRKIENGLLKIA